MHYLKRVFLGAAISLFSLSCSFSVFAGTPDTEDSFFEPTGPGVCQEEEDAAPVPQEISLGEFTVTGYCGCSKCSGGWGLTYSGTVPTPDHTISADLEQFPLGTKLKINGIVYTVEDKGSSVHGNLLDIFYGSHEEALDNGTYTAEVFLVQE